MKLITAIVMIIELAAPGSFTCGKAPVVVYDYATGQPFYASTQAGDFNLPMGKYKTNCPVMQYPKFTQLYNPIPLDAPNEKTGIDFVDGNTSIAKRLDFAPGNKASFFPDFNLAIMDKAITAHWFKPLPLFVMCHEEGHHYYKQSRETNKILDNLFAPEEQRKQAMQEYYDVEHKCDVYSRNKMVRNGYNDLQIIQAISMLLGKNNPRVQMLINDIKQAA